MTFKRLINQVAEEIWECRDGAIHKWNGDILAYKDSLIQEMIRDKDIDMAQSADNKPVNAPKNTMASKISAPVKVREIEIVDKKFS